MDPYRESEPRKLPTWWEGFRGGFGRVFGKTIAMFVVGGWGVVLPLSMAAVFETGDAEVRLARTLEQAEHVTEVKLVQERKFCKQQMAEQQELYLEALKQERDLARREALCNYLKSTWHEGRCFDYEISTDKTYTVRQEPVRP